MFAAFHAAPAAPAELLGELGLTDHQDTAYRNLSGGQKQRLSIALALVGRPRVAILDELSTGPRSSHPPGDVAGRRVDSRPGHHGVLLVTHLMEEVERLADRVAVFRDGRVIAIDTPAGIVAQADPEQRVQFRPSVALDRAAAHRPARRFGASTSSGRRPSSPGAATCCPPSQPFSPATGSSPGTCASSRPTLTTPSSPSPAACRPKHKERCDERMACPVPDGGEAAVSRARSRGSRRSLCPSAILLIFGTMFASAGHRMPGLGGLRFIDVFVPSLVVVTVGTLGIQTLPVRLATYRETRVSCGAFRRHRPTRYGSCRAARRRTSRPRGRARPAHRRRPRRVRRPVPA